MRRAHGGTLRGTARSACYRIIRQVGGLIPASPTAPLPKLRTARALSSRFPREIAERLADRIHTRLRAGTSAHENQRRLFGNPHLANRMDQNAEWSVPAGFCLRYPLLDPEVVTLALAVPERLLMLEGRTRTLIREALAGVYPELILRRRGKFPSHPRGPGLIPEAVPGVPGQ